MPADTTRKTADKLVAHCRTRTTKPYDPGAVGRGDGKCPVWTAR